MYTTYITICAFNTYPNAKLLKTINAVIVLYSFFLTSSSCHPKFFVKEFCYFLMSCHQHCLGINLLVQR